MKTNKTASVIVLFGVFVLLSFIFDLKQGQQISNHFFSFSKNMGLLLPCVFILIGLFEVWVKKETVEKHLGALSGVKGYILAIILSMTTVGGLIVALPMAISIFNKGAKASVVYTFIFSSAICRIPMTIFEATFLGMRFTIIRLLISLPLIMVAILTLLK